MLRPALAVVLTAVATLSCLRCECAAAVAREMTLVRASVPPPLDPTLSAPAWRDAPAFADFTDMGSKARATQATRAAVLYDDRAIYVGFTAAQTAPVVATQTTNDVGFGTDDFVGIAIDVGGNGERVYSFYVTPRGTRYDAATESTRYRPDWTAAAATTDRGWNAVLRIPYSAMHLQHNGPQRWRVNFVRNVAASAEHHTWTFNPLQSYQPIPNWPSPGFDWRFWPTVSGVSLAGAVPAPKPKAELYALESTGAKRDEFTLPNGTLVQRPPRTVGADVSIPLDPTISFVGAFSPDFSNVEVDQQTIAPQQFRRNLTEYRPFFAQGAPFVSTKLQFVEFNLPNDTLFYTPNFGPFDRGLKLVGTHANASFGALEIRGSDPLSGATFDDLAFGLRYRRPSNTLAYWVDGVVANHRTATDRTIEIGGYGRSLASGLVYGFDHAIEAGSAVTAPGRAQRTEAFVDIQKPGLEAAVGYIDIGPQYAPLDGFTNLADIRGPNAQVSLARSFTGGPFKNAELYFYGDRWLDRTGAVHAEDVDAYLTLRLRSPLAFYANAQIGTLRTYDGDFYSGEPHGYRNTLDEPFKTHSLGVGYGEGTPTSIRVDDQFGPFGAFYLNQLTSTVTRALGKAAIAVDYAGTIERRPAAAIDGQWLRRVTIALPFGLDGSFNVQYRSVSGRGGNATPGHNVAAGLRYRFRSGDELFVNYGTPNAASTLPRLIVKFLLRVNGGV